VTDFEGRVNAPDFPEGLEWLNTERPLTLRGLRGKVVLLDFWTYCCINCLHVIPELARLEEKYPLDLVVIGVHSAKFTNEQGGGNLRQAVLRYGVRHPVVNDPGLTMWREYGVRAWPTLVLIDPAGKVAGVVSGEAVYETLDQAINALIATFEARGQLDRGPLSLRPETPPAALLAFPGKVLADEASGLLFVADTNHHRILAVSLADSVIREAVGSGIPGLADGGFGDARFNRPHGMAWDGRRLFVADTDNHAIRLADFTSSSVTTLAGTGEQARRLNQSGEGRRTPLNSPWDVALHGGSLYIAMAGPHQLWRLDLATLKVGPYAGSGREGRIDGPLSSAALAQPSGLTTDGERLYFADSEDSSIRAADLRVGGRVETIVGGDLFEFGDRDGVGLDVRLQHPIGLTYLGGGLIVADTYNHKIKRVEIGERRARTLLGTGQPGFEDGDRPSFYEPEGVSVAGGALYIADTNNHAVRVADLATGRVTTLEIKGEARVHRPAVAEFEGRITELPRQFLRPGRATLSVAPEFAPGYHANLEAPSSLTIASSDEAVVRPEPPATLEGVRFPVEVALTAHAGRATLRLDLTVYYCQQGEEALCLLHEARVSLPVEVCDDAPAKTLTATLAATLTVSLAIP